MRPTHTGHFREGGVEMNLNNRIKKLENMSGTKGRGVYILDLNEKGIYTLHLNGKVKELTEEEFKKFQRSREGVYIIDDIPRPKSKEGGLGEYKSKNKEN